jgi:hypothetical protein
MTKQKGEISPRKEITIMIVNQLSRNFIKKIFQKKNFFYF